MRRLLVILVVFAGAAVLADNGSEGTDWSPVVYPAQRLPLIFSHAKHLARGMQCGQCHTTAAQSRSAVDNLIPTEVPCRACHAIERDKPTKVATPVAACTGCHAGFAPGVPVERVYLTPPPLKFDHAQHGKTPCEGCHPNMRAIDLATTRQLPTMASCLECHTNGADERHCSDCHLTKLGGLMETHFEFGTLEPQQDGLGDTHGPGFLKDHVEPARAPGATCTACHDRSECIACHQGVVKPMDFHVGNYLLVHATEARRGTPDCSACHRYETFCVGCHEREGLGTRGLSAFDSNDPAKRFHPIGWSSPQKNLAMNLHAQEARRNIASCSSCHREEDCLACHSAEPSNAVQASPHPRNWRGSAQCRAQDRANRRMCLRCHVSRDQLGCDW
ncbi:MAG TPA: cytochrome c3 family protein [Kofleriaceae bacterium]